MIHFYDEIVANTLQSLKESYDCADVLNDLNRIYQAVANVNSHRDCTAARQLDQELRQKYPCIDKMLGVANSMLTPAPQTGKTYSENEAVASALKQDYYGILCDTAIKKHLVRNIHEFIKGVD